MSWASVGHAPARAATVRRFSSTSPRRPVWRSIPVACQAALNASTSVSRIAALVSSQPSQSARGNSYTSVPNRSKTTASIAAHRGPRPFVLEDRIDDEVVEPVRAAFAAALDPLADEPQAFGDRPAPQVLHPGADLDPVQAQVAEPHVDQRAHRPRDQAAALLGGRDPVPDLAANAERVPPQAGAPGVPPVDEDPAPVERALVVHDALEPPPLVVDRPGGVDPRHPGFEAGPFEPRRAPRSRPGPPS